MRRREQPPNHRAASIRRQLAEGVDEIRVNPSGSTQPRSPRIWQAAAAVLAVVAVGATALMLTKGEDDRRISSPSSAPGPHDSSSPTSVPVTTVSVPSESAERDMTPLATETRSTYSIGGGFDLLPYPKAAFADTAADLADLLADARSPVDVESLAVDWSAYAVIAFARPTDACPSVFAGVTIDDGVLRPLFANPGYEGCDQPLLSHSVLAAVDRVLLTDVDRVELPALPPHFDTAVSVAIAATPSSSPPTAPPAPAASFGVQRGAADLPAISEAAVAVLDDGTPVIVVNHYDGTVSAIQPWSDATEPAGSPGLVRWIGSTRTFLGNGAWDEYGRRLDGPRATDLLAYATRTDDNRLEIGDPVQTPVGSPIGKSDERPAQADIAIRPENRISLTDAFSLTPGETRWIDADVVIDPAGAHLCDAPGFQGSPGLAPCPEGSPSVDAIEPTPESRTIWFGPILASRTDTGFNRIVPTGGYASSVFGPGLPPPVTP